MSVNVYQNKSNTNQNSGKPSAYTTSYNKLTKIPNLIATKTTTATKKPSTYQAPSELDIQKEKDKTAIEIAALKEKASKRVAGEISKTGPEIIALVIVGILFFIGALVLIFIFVIKKTASYQDGSKACNSVGESFESYGDSAKCSKS